VLDAWGALDPDARHEVDGRLRVAVHAATRRVAAELRALADADPAAQRWTPLELVRGAVREPTAVLTEVGVSDVVRDAFEERSLPDDRYGLAPRTFAELDDTLGPVQLGWGIARAAALQPPST
jgi:hypothetical protein